MAILLLTLAAADAGAQLHQATPVEELIRRYHAQRPAAAAPAAAPEGFNPLAVKAFTIDAHQFDYDISPSPFVVNQGDSVTITLRALDDGVGDGHGFFLELYAQQNNIVEPGQQPRIIQFVANQAGTFGFFCTSFCGAGHTTMSGTFTVNAVAIPPPVIGSFTPTQGSTAGGDVVTIAGSEFQTGASVSFGTTASTDVTVSSSTSILARAPVRPAGPVAIRVANPDGQSATSSQLYTYVDVFEVTSVSPASGSTAGGTQLTITGNGFLPGASVAIGDLPALGVTVQSSTSIQATTPKGPADIGGNAPRDIVVTNPGGATARRITGFTWLVPAPSITWVVPQSGPTGGGTRVTISGAGFSSAVGLTVSFGGVPGTDVRVIDAATIDVLTPARAAGSADVLVQGSNGTVTAAGAFSFAEHGKKRRSARH